MTRLIIAVSLGLLSLLTIGCSGLQSYPNRVSAGDTVSLGLGWQKNFNRSNTTVTITPASGPVIVYSPNDPAVRGIMNLYPDPLSYMVVGNEIVVPGEVGHNQNYTNGQTYGGLISNLFTDMDKDWWQTTAFIDLPTYLPLGVATVELSNGLGDTKSSTVEIIASGGSPDDFNAELAGVLTPTQFADLERSPYYEVSFTSATIPHAIEVQVTHNTDLNNGGAGKIYVVNPRGDLKSIFWSDNGTQLTVSLIPTQTINLTNMNDFKFYITGGIQGVVLQNIQAFDIDGNEVVNVVASVTPSN